MTRKTRQLISTGLCSLIFMSASASAAEACPLRWEYKMVQPNTASSLRINANTKAVAAQGLQAALNALGNNGWELISQHRIDVEFEEPDAKARKATAKMSPAIALFKRRIPCE